MKQWKSGCKYTKSQNNSYRQQARPRVSTICKTIWKIGLKNDSDKENPWLKWAVELQFIAQVGVTYSKDPFDLERFERIREISAEIRSVKSGWSLDKVKDVFCNESGFQTPKLDTRAAIGQQPLGKPVPATCTTHTPTGSQIRK